MVWNGRNTITISKVWFPSGKNRGKEIAIGSISPYSSNHFASIKESLTIEWTYNSNSIEGNTLTLLETKLVLEEGLTISGKSLQEHFEVLNHQDAIEFVQTLVSPKYQFKTTDVLNVHALVLAKIGKDFAERFRTSTVRISGADFLPPNAQKVSALMDELIDWVNDTELNPLIKAAIFHHRFLWIHLFFDGNGRTVCLMFNLFFMKLGFPPAIILKNDRKKYYDALNEANN